MTNSSNTDAASEHELPIISKQRTTPCSSCSTTSAQKSTIGSSMADAAKSSPAPDAIPQLPSIGRQADFTKSTPSLETLLRDFLPRLRPDCDPFDFVNQEQYFEDLTINMSYDEAVKCYRRAGPRFLDRNKQRCSFDDLSYDVQMGLITTVTRQIQDMQEFARTMPKGQWSDYESRVTKQLGNESDEDVEMSDGGRNAELDANVISTGSDSRVLLAAMTASSDTFGPRKDSARSVCDIEQSGSDKHDGTTISPQKQPASDAHRIPQHTISRHGNPVHIDDSPTTISGRIEKNKTPQRRYTRATISSPTDSTSSPPSTPARRHRRVPHDLIIYADNARTIIRRAIPAVENSWHISKGAALRETQDFDVKNILSPKGSQAVVRSERPLYKGLNMSKQ